jgi:hypothetical protein
VTHLLCQAVVAELATTGRASFGFSFWHSFDESDWRHAMDWLDVSGLALYFWHKVNTVNAVAALPVYAQTRLAESYEENRLRVESIRKESETLNRLFDEAGVQYAVLKGLALVPDYCPDPTLRTQYDHDYLIHPNALTRAETALQKEGYRPKVSREDYHIAYCRPEVEGVPAEKPAGLYSARMERPIELHIRLWDHAEEKIAIRLPEDFLDRTGRHRCEGFEFPALCDEDRLVFQVLHAFRHILHNWCQLSIFLEMSHFLQERALDCGFWMRFQDRARSLRWMPEASTVVFRLVQKLFGVSAPAEFVAQVSPRFSAIVDLWIDRYGLSGALGNFQNNKCSLFIHREFVDDRSVWAEVCRRRLFPFRRPHHLPKVLSNHEPTGLRTKWAHYLHSLQRLKFHVCSAIGYAWEYPRWRILRAVRTHDQPGAAGRGGEAKTNQRTRDSRMSAEPVVTQLSKTPAFRN